MVNKVRARNNRNIQSYRILIVRRYAKDFLVKGLKVNDRYEKMIDEVDTSRQWRMHMVSRITT